VGETILNLIYMPERAPARPCPYKQAIVDRISPIHQAELLTPIEDVIVTGRFRIRPPLTMSEISRGEGIPQSTLRNWEIRAIHKILKRGLIR
jgi:hypothetical protein